MKNEDLEMPLNVWHMFQWVKIHTKEMQKECTRHIILHDIIMAKYLLDLMQRFLECAKIIFTTSKNDDILQLSHIFFSTKNINWSGFEMRKASQHEIMSPIRFDSSQAKPTAIRHLGFIWVKVFNNVVGSLDVRGCFHWIQINCCCFLSMLAIKYPGIVFFSDSFSVKKLVSGNP